MTDTVALSPRDTLATPSPPALAVAPQRADDLALHRFLAGAQLLGGATLIASYALGGPSLPIEGSADALVGLGVAQGVVGATLLARPMALRWAMVRHPGAMTILLIAFCVVVSILGGSSKDSLFATSVWCALALGGVQLPGLRWMLGAGLVVALSSAGWAIFDDGRGGYEDDGELATAVLGMTIVGFGGMYLGRVVGRAVDSFDRAGAVLRHEHAVLASLRAMLRRVDAHARKLGHAIDPRGVGTELNALRTRLLVAEAHEGGATVAQTLAGICAECSAPELPVHADVAPAAAELALAPAAVDAIATTVRRQIANVHRHAPAATRIVVGARLASDALEVWVEDDGGGRLPVVEGDGTRWSARQLRRLGGSGGYYDAAAGLGFRLRLPQRIDATASDEPGLSVRRELDGFITRVLVVLRLASYAIDTLIAAESADRIGAVWLAMPIGAAVIELVLRRGLLGLRLDDAGRVIAAAVCCLVLVAIFSWPADMPLVLVPSSTSAVVLAQLVYRGGLRAWLTLELLRLVIVAPMIARHGGSALDLAVIYPLGFSALVYSFARSAFRARGVDRAAADAIARASLATAAVRGLALRHDAIDALLRAGPISGAIEQAALELEGAIDAVAASAVAEVDPREALLLGIGASMLPIERSDSWDRANVGRGVRRVETVVDRATLIELGTLIARERASCTPPGWTGRRRLRALSLEWAESPAEGAVILAATARPSLQPPDPARLRDLVAVAETLGVAVRSTPERLELEYRRR